MHTRCQLSLQNLSESFFVLTCASVRFHRCWLTPIMLLNSRHIKTASFHSLYNPLPGNKSLKGWQRITVAAISLLLCKSPSLLHTHKRSITGLGNVAFLSVSSVSNSSFQIFHDINSPWPPSGNSSPDESRANEIRGCDLWVIVIPTFCWMYQRRGSRLC